MVDSHRFVSVIGDIARDVHARITGVMPEDLIVAGDTPAHIQVLPGGSAATTAAWLATTGHPVLMIGARGDDHSGQAAESDLALWGVEPRLQIIPGASTGTVVVIVDARGERTMLPDAGANGCLDPGWCVEHLGGRHLHISAYTWFRPSTRSCVTAALSEARSRSMSTSIDVNSHGLVHAHVEEMVELLQHFDVVFANTDEFHALADRWSPSESTTMVVKAGAEGARWIRGGDSGSAPAGNGPVVDTVGAGDAFAAGFLSTWLLTGDPQAAIEAGNDLAADCVARVGPGPT